MDSGREQLARLCSEVLAPLIRADGGEMHLVSVEADEVRIHLSGACAGCPGASLTAERVLVPAILLLLPRARVTVTTGVHPPEGALHFGEG